MAKMGMNDQDASGSKQVLEIHWQEAIPFALELKRGCSGIEAAMPERVRYVELEHHFSNPRVGEHDRFEPSHQGSRPDAGNDWILVPGILCDGADEE